MNKKLGFIGCGNMAQAMLSGIIGSGIISEEQIIASALSHRTTDEVSQKYNIETTQDNIKVATECEIIILAVKPQFYAEVIDQIKHSINSSQIIVSIAAGKTIANLEELFGSSLKIIRTMPNTPSMVGEGMTGICKNENVTEEELDAVCQIFNSFGKTQKVTEKLMDTVVAVSGSSPAYVFMFIEALADGAVLGGMPRQQAYEFAAQAVLGSAKMVLETGLHPAVLKDNVCSPGGTTIEAVKMLEEKGLRNAVMSAMKACIDKSKNM